MFDKINGIANMKHIDDHFRTKIEKLILSYYDFLDWRI